MKKIILSFLFILPAACTYAQTEKGQAPVQSASAEPLVNGIPYSQYKARQEALKQEQAARNQAAIQQAAAQQTKGLTLVTSNESKTADPALERMKEPVLKAINTQQSKATEVPAAVVSNQKPAGTVTGRTTAVQLNHSPVLVAGQGVNAPSSTSPIQSQGQETKPDPDAAKSTVATPAAQVNPAKQ